MERMLTRLMRRRSLLQQGAAAPMALAGAGATTGWSSLFSTQQQQQQAADPGVLPGGLRIRDSASQLIGRTPMVYLNKVTEDAAPGSQPSSSSSSPPSASKTGHLFAS
ncbi:hypothetical protein BS78_K285200 [Paspalum vaginatum]|uniref:Uncharacterized protein n=1 Tax=Paspalum vaginatum TaxID=158149 RepID=A0A9W7XB77_9POAL|nr:hypothetical protein BS78_K285200 [Paspalum vaginatum]